MSHYYLSETFTTQQGFIHSDYFCPLLDMVNATFILQNLKFMMVIKNFFEF